MKYHADGRVCEICMKEPLPVGRNRFCDNPECLKAMRCDLSYMYSNWDRIKRDILNIIEGTAYVQTVLNFIKKVA